MYLKESYSMNVKNFRKEIYDMPIKGIYIFKSDSGITLYSKRKFDVQEDLFSAFLTALKSFFGSLALGGLSSFSSENFIFYLATANNCLTALVVDINHKSDKYFSLAYEISTQFYNKYQQVIDSKNALFIPGKEKFDEILDNIIRHFEQESEQYQQDLFHLYKITNSGELEQFPFINDEQLYNEELFLAVNLVTKRIFIVENASKNVSTRKLFLANRSASNLNQNEFKSEFQIRNVADEWDFERIIEMICKLVKRESFSL